MGKKRKQKRCTKLCEAECTANDITIRGMTSNLSLDGIFIRTNHPFILDTIINIELRLPNDSISKLKGRVKRAIRTDIGTAALATQKYKNGMGVEIIEKDDNYIEFIKSLYDKFYNKRQ